MSDINKVYVLLERLYTEFQENKDEVNQRLTKIESRLENDLTTSLQALHERYEISTSKLDEHSSRLNAIENKLDYLALSVNSQDKRLTTVEESRKRKAE